MLKNETLIILFSFFLLAASGISQSPLDAKFMRNGEWVSIKDYAVCPNIDVEYQIQNWNPDCHTLSAVNAYQMGDLTEDVSADGKIILTWRDTGDSCKLVVGKRNESGCSTAAASRTFLSLVLSLAKTKPKITQTPVGKLRVGFTHQISYKAEIHYPFLGKKDSMNLDAFRLETFVWTVPSGWTLNSGGQSNIINVTTDLGTGGNVTAKALNRVCFGTGAVFSDIGTYKAERSMASPCPVIASIRPYELCGEPIQNTFTCQPLPLNFTQPPTGVTWSWSVSPSTGWTKLGELDNAVKYQTDGQQDRTITVKVSAYGVDSSCSLIVPLLLVNPLTKITGPDNLCSNDIYKLTIAPAAGTSTSWVVNSLSPGYLPPVTPLSGTGSVASLQLGSGSANCQITFTVSGCGKTKVLKDTFFAGKPIIRAVRVDGKGASFVNFICPNEGLGSHWITVKLEGDDDNCINNWTSTGAASSFGNCNEFDFTLQYNPQNNPPYNTVYVTGTASNDCGTTSQTYVFMPSYYACDESPWSFTISPNPATERAFIQLYKSVEGYEPEICQIGELQLLNSQGNLVKSIDVNNSEVHLSLDDLLSGRY